MLCVIVVRGDLGFRAVPLLSESPWPGMLPSLPILPRPYVEVLLHWVSLSL